MQPEKIKRYTEIEEENKDFFSGSLVVADDILGGIYALNKTSLKQGEEKIYYFAPDSLEWEDLDINYNNFLYWVLFGDTETFYDSMRWSGWEKEVAKTDKKQGILIYPYLWAEGEDIERRNKNIVPYKELLTLNIDMYKKLN